MSILGLLGVLFIGLKLAGIGTVATWSWWLVTIPFWGGLAIWLLFFVIALVFAAITHSHNSRLRFSF